MVNKKQLTQKQIELLLELLRNRFEKIHIVIQKWIGRMCKIN